MDAVLAESILRIRLNGNLGRAHPSGKLQRKSALARKDCKQALFAYARR
jgi:hypothetical protein